MLDYRFQWRRGVQTLVRIAGRRFSDAGADGVVRRVGADDRIGAFGLAQVGQPAAVVVHGRTWVALARNTPALLQIYLFYFGLGAVSIHMSSYAAVLAAITFNNAGYLTEILRGGMDAISPAQRNAAIGLGMRPVQVYVFVIIPQVLRIVFLPITNQIVWAMMGTSLGMIIGLQELTGMTTFLQSQTFRPFEFYLVAAVIYLIVAESILITARLTARYSFRW